MNWNEMIPAQFDKTKVPDKAARKVIETAPATLFPSLMPEVQPQHRVSKPAPGSMDGDVPLFGLGDGQ